MNKLNHFLVLCFLILSMPSFSQVGIGTTTPNGSSILDLSSTNKGLMLPRVDNTSLVSNPSEGLMVYDKDKKAPYFYDGTSWRVMMGPPTVGIDSLTYTVLAGYTSPTPPVASFTPFVLATYNLESFNLGVSNNEFPGIGIFNISKIRDRSSNGLLMLFIDRARNNVSNSVSIEVKVYKKGATLPYYSYKFTDLTILATNMSTATGGLDQLENYVIQSRFFGWKDLVHNTSLAIDGTTGNYVAY
ncbi:MAG: hypothetical protein WAT79_16645 [Saprospiraceae bacterium]